VALLTFGGKVTVQPNNLFIYLFLSVMFGSKNNNNNLQSGITQNNSSDEKFQRTDMWVVFHVHDIYNNSKLNLKLT
jgi:hypothetical protein